MPAAAQSMSWSAKVPRTRLFQLVSALHRRHRRGRKFMGLGDPSHARPATSHQTRKTFVPSSSPRRHPKRRHVLHTRHPAPNPRPPKQRRDLHIRRRLFRADVLQPNLQPNPARMGDQGDEGAGGGLTKEFQGIVSDNIHAHKVRAFRRRRV